MLDIIITIVCVAALVLLWIMLYDSHRFVITKHKVIDARIKKPFKAVLLTDLHNKTYGKENEKLLAAIEECEPDLILVAGDILTAKPGESLDVAEHFVRAIAARYPVYYGNGNHEHRIMLYRERYGDMHERYTKILEEAGVIHLVNDKVSLPDYGVTIYGSQIDAKYYKRFKVQDMSEEYLSSALGKVNQESYSILLAHNPDYFPQYAAWGADLVCSGHVHGGMVKIPFWKRGVLSPNVRFFPEYDGGVFRQGDSTMLLSHGLGMHTIPVRLFNPGEIYLVEFAPEAEK